MTDGDDKLSRRYRELAREVPSAALDAAILAASRRAVAKPSFSRRWGIPVSIAAVIVLGFGLTLEMQHEKPDVSTSPVTMPSALPPGSAPMQAPEAESPAEAKMPEAKPKALAKPEAPRVAPQPRAQSAPASRGETLTTPVTATPPPAAPPVIQVAPAARAPAAADYNAAPAYAPAPARAKSATSAAAARIALSPEQELERIAKLRADGNDAEADRLLEEFRRAHPGYQIPEPTWERVKPR
ncbi:MAG: hypothetical protein WA190_02180 [Usitatibacter sp.]